MTFGWLKRETGCSTYIGVCDQRIDRSLIVLESQLVIVRHDENNRRVVESHGNLLIRAPDGVRLVGS